MLLELELPRVLAPDLSSNRYSPKIGVFTPTPLQLPSPLGAQYRYVPSRPQKDISIGNVARLLPSLEVVAIFKATSPEPNPDSLYPLKPGGDVAHPYS